MKEEGCIKFSRADHYKDEQKVVEEKLKKVKAKNDELRVVIKRWNKNIEEVQERILNIKYNIEDSTKTRETVLFFKLQQSLNRLRTI